MARMTDPMDALISFQEAFSHGELALQPGKIDPELFVFADEPNGTPRISYAKIEGQTVTALVIFVLIEPMGGIPCFQIGYAVPESFRHQGRAKTAVRAAIGEMIHGFGQNGIASFYIEAVVGLENTPSQRIAEELISDAPKRIVDELSKLSALYYLGKI